MTKCKPERTIRNCDMAYLVAGLWSLFPIRIFSYTFNACTFDCTAVQMVLRFCQLARLAPITGIFYFNWPSYVKKALRSCYNLSIKKSVSGQSCEWTRSLHNM